MQFWLHGGIAPSAPGSVGRRIASARLAWLLVRMHQCDDKRRTWKVPWMDFDHHIRSEHWRGTQESRWRTSVAIMAMHDWSRCTRHTCDGFHFQGTPSMGRSSIEIARRSAAGRSQWNLSVCIGRTYGHRLLYFTVSLYRRCHQLNYIFVFYIHRNLFVL